MSSDIEYDYEYDYDQSSIHQSLDWNSYDYHPLAEVHVEENQPNESHLLEILKGMTPCKLTLFSSTYFRGSSTFFNTFAESLGNFNDKVGSLKIEGECCWSLFTKENFTGDEITLSKGDYKSATKIRQIYKRAKSVKPHTC